MENKTNGRLPLTATHFVTSKISLFSLFPHSDVYNQSGERVVVSKGVGGTGI